MTKGGEAADGLSSLSSGRGESRLRVTWLDDATGSKLCVSVLERDCVSPRSKVAREGAK